MRPRMYGSSDSQRFFTSTSPSFGLDTVPLSMRKLLSVTQPEGRLARTIRLFSIILLFQKNSKRGETRQVVVGAAKLIHQHREAAEGVAHLQLLAHSHAAVQLHRFLADMARVVGDLDLRRRDGASPVPAVLRRIHL